jgi:hypothetical protein
MTAAKLQVACCGPSCTLTELPILSLLRALSLHTFVCSPGSDLVLHGCNICCPAEVKLTGCLQEAKVLMAVINHPNVLQFHGACLRDNLAMIVLEYMDVRDITSSSAHANGDEAFKCSALP